MPRLPRLSCVAAAMLLVLLLLSTACSPPAEQAAEGPTATDQPIRIGVLVADSECTPETAVGVLEGWIDAGDVPAVLGAICSSNVPAMAPVAEAGQVVVLSIGASNPAISDTGDFIFRSGPEMRDFLSGLEGHQGVAGTLAFDPNGDAEKEIRFFTVSGGVAEALSPELEEH